MKFDWITPPPAESVLRALENLVANGMIDSNGALTDIGKKVAECPLEVNVARMVSIERLNFPSLSYRDLRRSYSIHSCTSAEKRF